MLILFLVVFHFFLLLSSYNGIVLLLLSPPFPILQDIWDTICELLLHPHMWLRDVLNRLVALYFASVKNHDKSLETFFLMRPSRLFLISVSLCCQLNGPLVDNASSTFITQNLSFALCTVHSLLGPDKLVGACSIWSTLEHHEQGRFFEAFELLDSGKGGSIFVSLTSGDNKQNAEENSDRQQSLLVTLLLKRMGKIALQMDAVQVGLPRSGASEYYYDFATC